ncbi:MAG TPA: phosphoglucomutase/phosphomannomutase family protein [Terriglobia bacterium]|nr:phosphoglucomutase/phosphomannomutase family protein [Terriglobia bacterium]
MEALLTESAGQIKFGTDGWRGIIGDTFIFENVRRVAVAIARYVSQAGQPERGLVVGYDTRFLSAEAAREAARQVAAEGIPVLLADRATPTPAVSYAVVARKTAGALMVTASHNPYVWNGIKLKAPYGGSASPDIMKQVEKYVPAEDPGKEMTSNARAKGIETADLVSPYLDRIKTLVSLDRIRESGKRFVIDPMFGAARGCLARVFEDAGISFSEIHGEHNPLFPGINPEPIDPHLAELSKAVVKSKSDAGFATDGDADRIGAVDAQGNTVDSHKIFSILLRHLVAERGQKGEVVKTVSTTQMIDKIAAKYGLPIHITPIGFKYVCELMLARDILIGGEESGGIAVRGHLPERDGVLNSLYLADIIAERGKDLGELVRELEEEFGPHYYRRVDLEIDKADAQRVVELVREGKLSSVANFKVLSLDGRDGVKMMLGDSMWALVRTSGTENVLRLYAEAPSREQVTALLDAIVDFARQQSR